MTKSYLGNIAYYLQYKGDAALAHAIEETAQAIIQSENQKARYVNFQVRLSYISRTFWLTKCLQWS